MYDRTTLYINEVEVSNAWRTLANIAKAKADGLYNGGYTVSCEADWRCWQDADPLFDMAGALSTAPWFNVYDPASFEFLGLTIESMTGLDTSTSTHEMVNRVTRGGVAGRRFDGPRRVVVTAQMHAVSARGMAYGQQWLTSILGTCDDCAGAEGTLTFRAACAPVGSELDYRRSTTQVTLQSMGEPQPILEDDPGSMNWFQSITFTLGLGSPDFYSEAFAPGGFVALPVYVGGAAPCTPTPACCDVLRDLRRFQWRTATSVAGGYGAAPIPTITISAGATPLWMRVEVHQQNGDGTGVCVNQQPMGDGYACDPPIAAMDIRNLPANSTLVLSGATGRSYLYPFGGGPALPGDPYIDPLGTKGVVGLLDICNDVCVFGAPTDLQPVSTGAEWSCQFQYRYRIG